MSGDVTYQSAGLAFWQAPGRTLRLDADGLSYRGTGRDYAIPIGDLGQAPFLGLGVSPLDIVNAAAELARAAGVTLLEA